MSTGTVVGSVLQRVRCELAEASCALLNRLLQPNLRENLRRPLSAMRISRRTGVARRGRMPMLSYLRTARYCL